MALGSLRLGSNFSGATYCKLQCLYQIGNCDSVTFHERDGQNFSAECFVAYYFRLLKTRWKILQMKALLKMQLILMREEWP